MDSFTYVPPGFRFHPTDEELVDYYLRKKVASKRIDLDVIKDVDLYKIEPWDLQELCKIGSEEQSEWYFFSHKDKKYPTGTRTNRATKAGFWKATGRDKAIYTKNNGLVGMRKTLVFYKGRAPNGQKSDWIMHEYRLETNENAPPPEEGWVVCRVFKKRLPTMRKIDEYDSPCWYEDQATFMPDFDSPRGIPQPYQPYHHQNPCKQELDMTYAMPGEGFLQMPPLESPKLAAASSSLIPYGYERTALAQDERMIRHMQTQNTSMLFNTNNDQVTDWRVLDKFVASQLSHDNAPRGSQYSDLNSYLVGEEMNVESGISSSGIPPEFASSSASATAFHIDLDFCLSCTCGSCTVSTEATASPFLLSVVLPAGVRGRHYLILSARIILMFLFIFEQDNKRQSDTCILHRMRSLQKKMSSSRRHLHDPG